MAATTPSNSNSNSSNLSELGKVYKQILKDRKNKVEQLFKDSELKHLELLKEGFGEFVGTWLSEDELETLKLELIEIVRSAKVEDESESDSDQDESVGESDSEPNPVEPTNPDPDQPNTNPDQPNTNTDEPNTNTDELTQCIINAFERLSELNFKVWNAKLSLKNIKHIGMPFDESKPLLHLCCSYKTWVFMVAQQRDQDCVGGILGCSQFYDVDQFKAWLEQPSSLPKPIEFYCDLRCQNTLKEKLNLLLDFLDNFKTVKDFGEARYKNRFDLPAALKRRGIVVSKVDFKWDFCSKLTLGSLGFRCYVPTKPSKSLWIKTKHHSSNDLIITSSRYGDMSSWVSDDDNAEPRRGRAANLQNLGSAFGGKDFPTLVLKEGTSDMMADQIVKALNHYSGRFGFKLTDATDATLSPTPPPPTSSFFNSKQVRLMIDNMLERIKFKCSCDTFINFISCSENGIDPGSDVFIDTSLSVKLYERDFTGGSLVMSSRLPWIQVHSHLVGRLGSGTSGYIQVRLKAALSPIGTLDVNRPHHEQSNGETDLIIKTSGLYQDSKFPNFCPKSKPKQRGSRFGFQEKTETIGILDEFLILEPHPRLTTEKFLNQIEQVCVQFLPSV